MAEIGVYSTPERLYRYRGLSDGTLDQELKAIEEGYIYCPKIGEMNDPMEGAHDESRMLKALRVYTSRKAEVTRYIKKSGIASLSESNLSEPMWAYYANNFHGICIEYQLKQLAYHLPEEVAIVRMQYSEQPPTMRANRDSAEDRARMALSSKTFRWHTEREWRVLSPEAGPVAYGHPKVLIVPRVYVGARMPDDDAAIVIQRMHALKIDVHTMRIDKYALEFSQVERDPILAPLPIRPKPGTRKPTLTRPATLAKPPTLRRAAELLEKARGGKVPR